jgi:hypothetical protein
MLLLGDQLLEQTIEPAHGRLQHRRHSRRPTVNRRQRLLTKPGNELVPLAFELLDLTGDALGRAGGLLGDATAQLFELHDDFMPKVTHLASNSSGALRGWTHKWLA